MTNLFAEALPEELQPIFPKSSRIDVIGQNGNDGLIYHHNHKHGHASSIEGTSPTYNVWRGMKDRCFNIKNEKYPRYGARGITVCAKWLDFEEFLADMGVKPENKSIDRIDNNGNYEPDNCKWSTPLEQANNTSQNVSLTYQGMTKNLAEWVVYSGIPRTTFYRRYYDKGLRGDDLFKATCHMVEEKRTLENYPIQTIISKSINQIPIFAIQTLFTYGWDYIGYDDKDGLREVFKTKTKAQKEIDEIVDFTDTSPEEWRVVPYNPQEDDSFARF